MIGFLHLGQGYLHLLMFLAHLLHIKCPHNNITQLLFESIQNGHNDKATQFLFTTVAPVISCLDISLRILSDKSLPIIFSIFL